MKPNVFGLMNAVMMMGMPPDERPVTVTLGHDPCVRPVAKGIQVPKQRHAGGCNAAACRTLDRCLCSCKQCKHQCNGQ